MKKRFLLGGAVLLCISAGSNSVPFNVFDARSIGMGGTGVASAPLSVMVPYNPALLSAYPYRDEDYVSITPRIGFVLGDEDEIIKKTEDFEPDVKADAINTSLESVNGQIDIITTSLGDSSDPNTILGAISALNTFDVSDPNASDQINAIAATLDPTEGSGSALDNYLQASNSIEATAGSGGTLELQLNGFIDFLQDDISGSRLSGSLGGGFAVAIPSKKFAFGVSIDANVVGAGTVTVSTTDTGLLRDYISAGTGYVTATTSLNSDAATLGGATVNLAAGIQANDLTAIQESTATVNDCIQDDGAGDTCNINSAINDVTSYNSTGTNTNQPIFTDGELVSTDPDLESTVHLFGAVITDIALGMSREWTISDTPISIGIAPKLQRVDVFDIIFQVDGEDQNGDELDFNDIQITDYHKEYISPNLDIGTAYRFGFNERWTTGLTLKNIMGGSYESAEGQDITINPMARAGLSYYNKDYFLKPKFAVDLDLTSNEPTGFEDGTQYFAFGGEIDLFRTIQLRAGYRTNLSSSGKEVVTGGLGFSPAFLHINIAAFANPGNYLREFGAALDFGVEF